MLPERDHAAEDAFVRAFVAQGDAADLLEVIEEAMSARRPRLAARLVGLLPDEVDDPEGLVDAARRAARFLLLDGQDAPDRAWSALEDAWAALRRQRMHRIKHRMRDALAGRTERRGRLDSRRR